MYTQLTCTVKAVTASFLNRFSVNAMKFLPIVIIWLFSSAVFAKCTAKQESAEIDVIVIHGPKSVKTGGNQGMFDRITINKPAAVEGMPIVSMELTHGEVAEFWIPLAYTINSERAVTAITGHHNAIQHFEAGNLLLK